MNDAALARLSPRCPACGARDGVPIVYGVPTERDLDLAERKRVDVGGMNFGPDRPNWTCTLCYRTFRSAAPAWLVATVSGLRRR